MALMDYLGRPDPPTSVETQRANDEYRAERQAWADWRTYRIENWMARLNTLLARGLTRSARLDPDDARVTVRVYPLDLGPLATSPPVPVWADYAPPQPGWLSSMFGGQQRYDRELDDARAQFARARRDHDRRERRREEAIAAQRKRYEQDVARCHEQARELNAEIDRWIDGLRKRRSADVERYLGEVLAAVPIPKRLRGRREVTFDPPTEHAVVRVQLPALEAIPPLSKIAYRRDDDDFDEVARPDIVRQEQYLNLLAQITLLTVRDLFDADPELQQVTFNGHRARVNPANGQPDYPCLLSVTVHRAQFEKVVLNRVDPRACLQHLGAVVSGRPAAIEPVQPLIDFEHNRSYAESA